MDNQIGSTIDIFRITGGGLEAWWGALIIGKFIYDKTCL
jgi:hypothetical protein